MVSKISLGGGLTLLFAVTVLILTRVLPAPHRPTDYLVIGALATFFCMAILAGVFFVSNRSTGLFFSRRRK